MVPQVWFRLLFFSKFNFFSMLVWLVFKDKVYDVTDFHLEHPGGADLLTVCSSKDNIPSFYLCILNSLGSGRNWCQWKIQRYWSLKPRKTTSWKVLNRNFISPSYQKSWGPHEKSVIILMLKNGLHNWKYKNSHFNIWRHIYIFNRG